MINFDNLLSYWPGVSTFIKSVQELDIKVTENVKNHSSVIFNSPFELKKDNTNRFKILFIHLSEYLIGEHHDLWKYCDFPQLREDKSIFQANLIVVPTVGVQKRIKEIYNLNSIILPWPCKSFSKKLKPQRKEGVLIIGSYSKRKHILEMLKGVGDRYPVTVAGFKDAIRPGRPNWKFLGRVSQDKISECIESHRMLIQLSSLEVFPYSILESIPYIPCLIMKNSVWDLGYFDEAYRVPMEIDAIKNEITRVYNIENYKGINIESYIDNVKREWQKFDKEYCS